MMAMRIFAIRNSLVRTRAYKNIWGAQNTPLASELEAVRSVEKKDTSDKLQAESWKLDWEEDHRWVEWRLDREAQTESDKHRVQMEWFRFRDDRGRKWNRLWEDEDAQSRTGFNRGSEQWWRQKYYDQEFVGQNGVQSMESVHLALKTLEVTDAGDASAIRGAYLRLVNRWHPDRFQGEVDRKEASEKFRQITDAYNLLREYRHEP